MFLVMVVYFFLFFKGLQLIYYMIKSAYCKSQGIEIKPKERPLTEQERRLEKVRQERIESELRYEEFKSFMNDVNERSKFARENWELYFDE